MARFAKRARAKRPQTVASRIERRLNISIGIVVVIFIFLVLYGGVGFLYVQLEATALSPREYMYRQCQEPTCNAVLLDQIATCESQWRMVKNSQSSAYGYFQILDSTEQTTPQYKEGRRKFDPYTNVEMGIFLYESRGSNPWNESRHCWSPRYQQKLRELSSRTIFEKVRDWVF